MSDQSPATKARMASCTDNHVVVDRDAERRRRPDQRPGCRDIGGTRRRIARWMVVNQDEASRLKFERAVEDVARCDQRLGLGAGRQPLVAQQLMGGAEK